MYLLKTRGAIYFNVFFIFTIYIMRVSRYKIKALEKFFTNVALANPTKNNAESENDSTLLGDVSKSLKWLYFVFFPVEFRL